MDLLLGYKIIVASTTTNTTITNHGREHLSVEKYFRGTIIIPVMGESGWVKRRMIRWMEDNRGLILTVLGLPLSFLFDLVMQVRNWTYRVFLASPARHRERVATIQRQVR